MTDEIYGYDAWKLASPPEYERDGAPAAGQPQPIEGMCICQHNEPAHTQIDQQMQRAFPGQRWDGCAQCGCPFFRQEDEISVGMREGTLRVVLPEDEDITW